MAVLLLLYLVAEVAAVWAVASAIGFFPMLGLLLLGAFAGSWLARREGAKAARAFMETARAGRQPHAEITDGMLVALGGLLILIPGFVSDVAGLVLLLPTRRLVRRAWLRRIERRAPAMRRQPGQQEQRGQSGQRGQQEQPNRVIVVDSEVVESTDRPLGPQPGEPGFGMSK